MAMWRPAADAHAGEIGLSRLIPGEKEAEPAMSWQGKGKALERLCVLFEDTPQWLLLKRLSGRRMAARPERWSKWKIKYNKIRVHYRSVGRSRDLPGPVFSTRDHDFLTSLSSSTSTSATSIPVMIVFFRRKRRGRRLCINLVVTSAFSSRTSSTMSNSSCSFSSISRL